MPNFLSETDKISIQITTTTGHVHAGILLIHDPTSQVVVLTSQSQSTHGIDLSTSNPLVDFQIVKISSIKEIRVLGTKQEGFKPYEAKLITVQDIKAREELAQKRVLVEEKRLGIGVSSEGQKIYDAFERTYVCFISCQDVDVSRLPVKWVDKSIMVADQALINPPYTVDSVISVSAVLHGNGEDEKTTLLTRIKHVVCPFNI